ncbi:hypothetical protein C0993_001318, partial [Termitomyces sp. T159_Od127]
MPLQEVPPFLEGLDDGQHFLVMDLVVVLYHVQAFRIEGYWMPLPIIPGLLKSNSSSGKIRAVGFHVKGGVIIWEEEDRPG